MAGTDLTLLALAGIGLHHGKVRSLLQNLITYHLRLIKDSVVLVVFPKK